MNKNERTIVGGRSMGHPWSVDAPRGIEILLKKAKVDNEFRERFLEEPLATTEALGLKLSKNEKLILLYLKNL